MAQIEGGAAQQRPRALKRWLRVQQPPQDQANPVGPRALKPLHILPGRPVLCRQNREAQLGLLELRGGAAALGRCAAALGRCAAALGRCAAALGRTRQLGPVCRHHRVAEGKGQGLSVRGDARVGLVREEHRGRHVEACDQPVALGGQKIAHLLVSVLLADFAIDERSRYPKEPKCAAQGVELSALDIDFQRCGVTQRRKAVQPHHGHLGDTSRGDDTGSAKIGGLLQRAEPVVGTDRAAPRLDPSRHAVAAHVLAQRRERLGVRLERDDPAGTQRGQVDAVRADVRADVDHEIAGCEPAPHILEHPELVERAQAFAL